MSCRTQVRFVAPVMLLTAVCLWTGCSTRTVPVAPVATRGGESGPWDRGWPIPPSPQRPGDAAAGYDALINRGYISCGIPKDLWTLVWGAGDDPPAPGREPLPGRRVRSAEDLPYSWNLHTTDEGVDLVVQNCLTCHGGRFNGELVLGLGNAEADFTFDLSRATEVDLSWLLPPPELAEFEKFQARVGVLGPATVMRTVGTNPAEMIAATLAAHHDRETLAWSDEPLVEVPRMVVASDPPPWWRAHKKHAMFANGMARGDHRGTMAVASSLCISSVEEAREIDSYFADINAYIRSLRAPAYPFEIDPALADEGHAVYTATCAGCHGTYGTRDDEDTYPNLLIPLEVIGTDPVVALTGTDYAPDMVEWFNESFYGEIIQLVPGDPFPGYMPPPLDGIWATGPFLHNGSVPTLELVLDSTARPTYWKRVDFDSRNFDEDGLGWPFVALDGGQADAPARDRNYIYDTTLPAHANTGHTFGDHLSARERHALLEYLKTL